MSFVGRICRAHFVGLNFGWPFIFITWTRDQTGMSSIESCSYRVLPYANFTIHMVPG